MSGPAEADFRNLAFVASFVGLLVVSRSLTFMIEAMTYPWTYGLR